MAQRALAQQAEEIRLILLRVLGAHQVVAVRALLDAGEMPGGQLLRAQLEREIQELGKFDFPIAQHIRIGRAARAVFRQKIREHARLVLAREIHAIVGNAQVVAHGAHIRPVSLGGASAGIVLFFPVVHKDARDIMALLLEQEGGDRRIDAARHAYYNFQKITPLAAQRRSQPG